MKTAVFSLLMTIALATCSCRSGGSTGGVLLSPLDISGKDGLVTVQYAFTAPDCMCTSEPVITGPDPKAWTLRVNGAEVAGPSGRFFIGGLVHEGENLVQICGRGDIPAVRLHTNGE